MADSDNDLLATLRRHNDELGRLLSEDGKEELDRFIRLELDLSTYTAERLRKLGEVERGNNRPVRLSESRPRDRNEENSEILIALRLPDPLNDVLEKIRSRINSYIADKVGGIAGGDRDADDT